MMNRVTKLLKLPLIFLGPIIVGTFGYYHIENWTTIESLYMTVITLTTIGFGEVHPLSENGKIFTIFLSILGIGNIAYIGSALVKFLIETKFDEIYGRRKMTRSIERLKDHTIICGFGRIGSQVCADLSLSGENFVVIEKEKESVEKIKEKGHFYIEGLATDEEILLEAGLLKAKALISVVSSDADNVFITLTAKHLNPKIMVVSRVFENSTRAKLKHAGADKIISPFAHAGTLMAQSIINPNVEDFIEFSSDKTDIFQVAEFTVKEDQPCQNRTLEDLKLKEQGIIIVNIQKENGEKIFAPHKETILNEGDKVVAIGNKSDFGKALLNITT